MKGKNRLALLTGVLALAIILRSLPAALTGLPADNDSWYILYDVRVVWSNPHEKLLESKLYDGYNNLWPGSILIPTGIGLAAGLKLEYIHVLGPLLDGTSYLAFYAIARRVTGKYALAATVVAALAPSSIGLGVGLVKENLGKLLFYALLLANLIGAGIPFVIMATALVITHHLLSVTLLSILLGSYIIAVIVRAITGVRVWTPPVRYSAILLFLIIIWNTATIKGQYILRIVGLFDMKTLAAYIYASITLLAVLLVLIGERPSKLALALASLSLYAVILIVSTTGLAPGIQRATATFTIYSAPILAAPILARRALWRLKFGESTGTATLPLAWVFILLGVVGYLALAGTPLGQSPVGRTANLMIPGIALMYGFSRSKLACAVAVKTLLAGFLFVIVLLSGADPASYYLTYTAQETYLIEKLGENLASNMTVYGDAKIRDLAYYYGLRIRVPYNVDENGLLVMYEGNLKWGYKYDMNLYSANPDKLAAYLREGNKLIDTGSAWLIKI